MHVSVSFKRCIAQKTNPELLVSKRDDLNMSTASLCNKEWTRAKGEAFSEVMPTIAALSQSGDMKILPLHINVSKKRTAQK